MDKLSFEKYWNNYQDTIQTILLRGITPQAQNISAINRDVKNASSIWDSERKMEGMWLRQYEQEQPEKAAMLKNKLLAFQLKEMKAGIPSVAKYYAFAMLTGLAATGVVVACPLSLLKTILLSVLCFVITFGFFVPLGNSNQRKACKETVRQYMQQVIKLKEEIDALIS